MNTLSKIAAGTASFALVALLSMPIAGAAGGDGTGPAPGTRGQQMMEKGGNNGAPCYGQGQGHRRGPCGGHHYRNCCSPCQGKGAQQKGQGPGQGRGGFVDKDGDGICDHHPDNGKAGEPAK